MIKISTLYHVNGKWYDYPIKRTPENENNYIHHDCMAKSGKTIKVYHSDGTMTIGYMFGEKQFTYSEKELKEHRLQYHHDRAKLNQRNKMLAKIATYDDKTLANIIKWVEG